jgi:hypothetical protein
MVMAELYGRCIWQWRKYVAGVYGDDGGDLRNVRVAAAA